MDNEKMARFIAESRKKKNLTQRELAEQLGVTDKAVSKWERGLSCPDIALLTSLSDLLGITTGELLNGERADVSAPEVEPIIETTLHYADAATKSKHKSSRKLFAVILTSISMLSIVICVICNLSITGRLTWALFPMSAVLFAWAIILPLSLAGKRGRLVSLVVFSLLIIPFLYSLERIIGTRGLIMPIGVPVSAITILYFWIIYFLFEKTKLQRYMATATSFMLAAPIGLWINGVVAKFTDQGAPDRWDLLGCSILALISIMIYLIGYLSVRKIAK